MQSLWGRRILVLEDEYFLAEELERVLDAEGAVVIGPCSAMAQVEIVPLVEIDGAVLNVRVRDGVSYRFAQKLRERGIPFVFASGQNRLSEPPEWHDSEWVAKPYEAGNIIAALHRVLGVISG
ncbi:response regulator [Lichenihabitans sp. Uapishka_5]|uniref:response regulator n=1 Tax=Lichenihabitans sp. Uapishka_5 TaxID=3037302 RepID=UPI0029E7FB36|nr:response regulator [Lichenihabitans sp. Uapishka_5]MDX7950529.1 response regulator [Lichenihabitans sp. Uapishka_5]